MHNPARGEVPFEAEGQSFVLCATAEGVAKLEAALGTESLGELMRRISGVQLSAVRTALVCLDCSRDSDKAKQAKVAAIKSLPSFLAASEALASAFNLAFEGNEGNAGAASSQEAIGSTGGE